MNPSDDARIPFSLRFAAVALFLLATSAIATTAYTRDVAETVAYVCAEGDRFTVEYRQSHARLRHGTGIFVLARDDSGPATRYTDGHLVLSIDGEHATLEPIGPTSNGLCFSEPGHGT